MQIVKNLNNVVLFAGYGYELTETGMTGPGFNAPTIKSTTHTIENVDSIPDDFVGGHYTFTEKVGWLRTLAGETALSEKQSELMSELKAACELAITNLIQSKVDEYNAANGLSLTDVKSCALYAQVQTYTHKAFCQAVWEWNVSVWEAARILLSQAIAGEISITSPDDVISLLPEFTWVTE